GTTEIAVLSLGGIVVNKSLKIAGDDMDAAILHYVRLRHGLLLGEKTAEDVKIKIGSAYENKKKKEDIKSGKADKETKSAKSEKTDKMAIIRGRDLETGLPKSLRISESEVREALAPILAEIVESIAEVAEDSPPELTSDILEHGIVLTGGGALLPGF